MLESIVGSSLFPFLLAFTFCLKAGKKTDTPNTIIYKVKKKKTPQKKPKTWVSVGYQKLFGFYNFFCNGE